MSDCELLTPGRRLGTEGWVLVRCLSKGAVAQVWEAHRAGRAVAAKLVPLASGKLLLKEAAHLRSVVSMGCFPRLIQGGIDRRLDMAFVLTELLEGETLAHRLQRSPLSPGEARSVLVALADVIDVLARSGWAHLDLSPSNIMLTSAAPGLRLLDSATVMRLGAFRPTTIFATRFYMPPMPTGPDAKVDATLDAYVFALLAFEVFTGVQYWSAARNMAPELPEIPSPQHRGVGLQVPSRVAQHAGRALPVNSDVFDAWFAYVTSVAFVAAGLRPTLDTLFPPPSSELSSEVRFDEELRFDAAVTYLCDRIPLARQKAAEASLAFDAGGPNKAEVRERDDAAARLMAPPPPPVSAPSMRRVTLVHSLLNNRRLAAVAALVFALCALALWKAVTFP